MSSMSPRTSTPFAGRWAARMTDAHGPLPGPGRRVLVVDVDPVLAELIGEWLAAAGCVVGGQDGDLLIVELPFPRMAGDRLRLLASEHPGTPILVLSSSFLAGIGSRGSVARTLGVAGVLPMPVTRESLLDAVSSLLAGVE
jgi:DNA-binding NarL/FixJ family response regulator